MSIFLPLFMILISYAPLAHAQGVVTIMTQNLHCRPFKASKKNIRPIQERVNRLLEIAKQENVSVLALQEVCSDQSLSAYELLLLQSEVNDIRWNFNLRTYTHLSWNRWREDLVLFSRQFPAQILERPLPDPTLGRAVQALRLPGQRWWFGNTHLDHSDHADTRMNQLQLLNQYFEDTDVLLMGDFNSSPADREGQVLWQAGWTAHFPAPTYPALKPEAWYDGLWQKAEAPKLLRSFTVDIGSDHLGVIYQYHIPLQ